jgi:hypothetical protein
VAYGLIMQELERGEADGVPARHGDAVHGPDPTQAARAVLPHDVRGTVPVEVAGPGDVPLGWDLPRWRPNRSGAPFRSSARRHARRSWCFGTGYPRRLRPGSRQWRRCPSRLRRRPEPSTRLCASYWSLAGNRGCRTRYSAIGYTLSERRLRKPRTVDLRHSAAAHCHPVRKTAARGPCSAPRWGQAPSPMGSAGRRRRGAVQPRGCCPQASPVDRCPRAMTHCSRRQESPTRRAWSQSAMLTRGFTAHGAPPPDREKRQRAEGQRTGQAAVPQSRVIRSPRPRPSSAPDRIHLAALDGLGGGPRAFSAETYPRLGSNLW